MAKTLVDTPKPPFDEPKQRPAQPAELAPIYVFLATHESSYVTGSVVDLTGGEMLP